MTLKNKSQFFWISQDFLHYRRYLQIFLSKLTCVYDWMDKIFQRQPQEIEPWELKSMFSDVGGPIGWVRRERKFLKLYLLERLKKHPPD